MRSFLLPLQGLTALFVSRTIAHDAGVLARNSGAGTPPPCSTVASIENGNFETGSLSPWATVELASLPTEHPTINATLSPSTGTVVAGTGGGHALQLNVSGHNYSFSGNPYVYYIGGSATIAQLVQACIATNYSIAFDYNLLNVGSDCSLSVSVHSGYTIRAHVSTTGALPTNGGWQKASLYYPNYQRTQFYVVANLQCYNYNDTALAQVNNFRVSTVGSLEPDNCPGRVPEIPNGGFESGALQPWNFRRPFPKFHVVSPGYKSGYALGISMPEITADHSYLLLNQAHGGLCLGYNYTFSFAVNWGNYSYPLHAANGCKLQVGVDHCSNRTGAPALLRPPLANSGWQEYSYSCLAGNSVGLLTYLSLSCVAYEGNPPPIPAFDVTFDSFTAGIAIGS